MLSNRTLEASSITSSPVTISQDVLDIADRMIDKYINQDNTFPLLTDKMKLNDQVRSSCSGFQEGDYPSSVAYSNIVNVNLIRPVNRIPLPAEILEQCGNLRVDYRMGLFPEISRAWLAIDSDIYLWNYETGADVAYYDGLNEAIISVGLVKPKPDVFQSFIENLLILTTPSEILVIGVLISQPLDNNFNDELQLTPEVIYALPTDSATITKVFGTNNGRIFLGGRDGCLYEIVYQKEVGWWGKRCKKVNHSKGALSFLVPSFVNSALYDEDAIIDMAVDSSRHILYTLTERGSLEVFDLGSDGWGMSRVASLGPNAISYSILSTIRLDRPESGNIEVGRVVRVVALDERESGTLGAVAVTSGGARLYLSTANSPRPTTLHVAHIRLPPGYAPNPPADMRSGAASQAHCLAGSFVISTTSSEGYQDKLWCLSGDIYATKTWFSEAVTEVNLSGKPVAIAEVPAESFFPEKKYLPLLVYEHNHTPDKIIVLTLQGTDIYEKLRPVDILADILRRRGGPDSEDVRNLFAVLGHDLACAEAVMLACDHWTTNAQIAEWAARALLIHGGEPKSAIGSSTAQAGAPLHYSTAPSPSILHFPQNSALPQCFKPREVSTPLGNKAVSMAETQIVQTSHKHNGLYIYLARILRPIWSRKIVSRIKLPNSNPYLVSSLFESDINKITSHLYALKLFLQKNTQIPSGYNQIDALSPVNRPARPGEARQQERQSLESLKMLVDHSLQVLGLWRLLAHHQFHVICQSLPVELQNVMPDLYFRDLICFRRDLCCSLIGSLVNLYLNDNTSVDSISNQLREVCPSLFKPQDAACSKANEVLLAAKDELDPEERNAKLKMALKLCKEVAGELNLSQVCRQLTQCCHYKGVIELCTEAAEKLDPHCLAHHYYSKNQPPEDTQGANAYLLRLKTYEDVTIMLDTLYHQCHPVSKSPTQIPNGQISSEAHATLERTIVDCLAVSDEICHVAVYEWLVARGLHVSLVSLGRPPSLERFLARHPHREVPPFRDLLWQHYETAGNHSAAAQVLYALATTPGDSVKFDQRLTYLGKAVMCMRSEGCAHHLGVFLHELEDLVQVARVQRQILDKIVMLGKRDVVFDDAIKKLNSGILNITELYEDFADRFQLWECKLTILECAGHNDRELIQTIWDNIITEVKAGPINADDKMALVMNKVKSLGLQFTVESPCFPVAYLVKHLEVLSCRGNINKSFVHSTMTSIGVSVQTLLEIYDRLYNLNERCWAVEGNEFHLIQVIASFADTFANNPRLVPAPDRQGVAVQMQDLLANCLTTVYAKPETAQLASFIKTIKTNLERIH